MKRQFDSVFVTGGAGYCGSLLVPQLLKSGYRVTVYDLLYFGSYFLPTDDRNLTVIQGDIRDTAKLKAAFKAMTQS
jgi:UDP-glucose 4-epimerase